MYINKKPRDENGLAHGEWLYYHDNGGLMYFDNWVHGFKHGLWRGYYNDGRLMYCQNWNMGKKFGYCSLDRINEYYLCLI